MRSTPIPASDSAPSAAFEVDSRRVELFRPRRISFARFMAEIGELQVDPDMAARVVLDARTGTVVVGQDVQISTVAVTYGTLTVRVAERPRVSQPAPFSNGRTVVTPNTQDRRRAGRRTRLHSRRIKPQSAGQRPEPDRRQAAGDHRDPSGDQNCRRAAGRSRHSVSGPARRRGCLQVNLVSPAQAARSRMAPILEADTCHLLLLSQRLTARSCRARVALSVAAVLLACPAFAQDGRALEKEKPKATANKTPDKAAVDKPPDVEASRFCANAAPSIAEARIAWETKQLSDLDAQVKQRLADLEKAEASVQRVGRQERRNAQVGERRPCRHLRQDAAGDRRHSDRRDGRSNGGGDPGQTQVRRGRGHSQ